MPVPFIASLRTNRQLERGVSYHGADLASVERPARTWLEAFGEHGDSFVVSEAVLVEHSVIVCDKPPRERAKRELKGHEFVAQENAARCGKCNMLEEQHN